MGCSRAGALAVVCVLAAGAVSMLSLLLPYWSKMTLSVPIVTTSASTATTRQEEQLEITFGLWGSCINFQPTDAMAIDTPVITNGSEIIAVPTENAASDLLTCGGYFDASMIHISCTSFRQLASGQCKRHDFEANATLCDAQIARAFLGEDVSSTAMASWLSFLEHACGRTGHASVVFGVLSSFFTGLSVVLLFVGISCARIDSWIGKMGAICAACTALCQCVVALLWASETRVVREEKVVFGTSFYLNLVSIWLHLAAFLAAKQHQRLERDAHKELSDDVEDVQSPQTKTAAAEENVMQKKPRRSKRRSSKTRTNMGVVAV